MDVAALVTEGRCAVVVVRATRSVVTRPSLGLDRVIGLVEAGLPAERRQAVSALGLDRAEARVVVAFHVCLLRRFWSWIHQVFEFILLLLAPLRKGFKAIFRGLEQAQNHGDPLDLPLKHPHLGVLPPVVLHGLTQVIPHVLHRLGELLVSTGPTERQHSLPHGDGPVQTVDVALAKLDRLLPVMGGEEVRLELI